MIKRNALNIIWDSFTRVAKALQSVVPNHPILLDLNERKLHQCYELLTEVKNNKIDVFILELLEDGSKTAAYLMNEINKEFFNSEEDALYVPRVIVNSAIHRLRDKGLVALEQLYTAETPEYAVIIRKIY